MAAASMAAFVPTLAAAETLPTLNWTQSAAAGPVAREGAYLAYDSRRSRTVLFGGYEPVGGKYDSDTWEYDGTAWGEVPVSGPPAGALGSMAYDAHRGVSVLFGGGNGSATLASTTWEWNGTNWYISYTLHSPPPRVWSAMTYDSARQVIVLFGGYGAYGLLNDTWEYNGVDWRQVQALHSPSPRYGQALAFDPTLGRTVLFGGHDTNGRTDDTWVYDGLGKDWTQVVVTNPPYARFWHAMAYDAALDRVVMFGGDYFVPSVTLGPNNETWTFDGSAWQQLAVADYPAPRAMASMVYDSDHSNLVLFGGGKETYPDQAFGDTWTFGFVGLAPIATPSTSFIDFGGHPTLSVTTQQVTVSNTGTAPLAITSIAAGGDFGSTDGCPRSPATLAVKAWCTVTVSFTPSIGLGLITGSLTLTDNAGLGTQSVRLVGAGRDGSLQVSPSPLDLGEAVTNAGGVISSAVETLTSSTQLPTTILTGFSATPPFTASNLDCPLNTPLSNWATCHVEVQFAPDTAGAYTGQLVIHDNEPGLQRVVQLSAVALEFPRVSVTLRLSAAAVAFGHTVTATATTDAASGTATFSVNGHLVGPAVELDASGAASRVLVLDNSTVPTGAGTYQVVVSVQPSDGRHVDGTAAQSIKVTPAPVELTWSGTGLAAAGTATKISAVVTPPSGETHFYDFSAHPVWVLFEIDTISHGVYFYYAQVVNAGPSGRGVATVPGDVIAVDVYTVRARLVAASGSEAANAYVSGDELRTAYAGQPVRGGYMSGWGQPAWHTAVAFEFTPAKPASGSLVVVVPTRIAATQGGEHDAYIVFVSTSVTAVGSHSQTATATGTAQVQIYDAVTGDFYGYGDPATTTFEVVVHADGSVEVNASIVTISLPAGSGINHL